MESYHYSGEVNLILLSEVSYIGTAHCTVVYTVPPNFLHIGTQCPPKPVTSEYASECGHSRAFTPKFYLIHRMQTTMKCVLFATRCLLQRNKLVSTNTGTAVASGLVRHGKLGKVVANHFSLKKGVRMQLRKRHGNANEIQIKKSPMLRVKAATNLDLDIDKELAVVNTNYGADHLRDDGHVSQVSLDGGRLVVGSGGLLSLAQLLEQRVVSTGNTACKTTTNAASQKLQKLLLALVQQSLELNATEAKREG